MKIQDITEQIELVGLEVKSFPDGIAEAFRNLEQSLPQHDRRTFYGLGIPTTDGMTYHATATAHENDDVAKYSKYVIPAGRYGSIEVKNWMEDPAQIRNTFAGMQGDNIQPEGLLVEWYKSDKEMYCIVQMKKQDR